MRLSRRQTYEPEEEYKPVYLTADGFARLKAKIAAIKEKLPTLAEETRRTAAYGDRSENAEYKEAKSSLRRANWQILHLEDQLKRVEVIKQSPNKLGKIGLGSTVTLKVGDKKEIFEILGSHESNPSRGRISYVSPLGAALMNRSKGDLVTIQTANGFRAYKIIEVR
ncbi:MAG: GreA/GreB family elongation factor [Patescibacteria group bacterium]|nr:GreA/GreB family elongation factor [Patescibacteria group bacterium]MDE2015656.1 GreA/GreB family elongation factor [Patescibacteria group bacterium]MDE2226713.1 GreA/GreB family elongation factor [Patescibacteria group bacterium]